jgi:hypothetical protein
MVTLGRSPVSGLGEFEPEAKLLGFIRICSLELGPWLVVISGSKVGAVPAHKITDVDR